MSLAKPELEPASVALAELLADPLAELVADPLLDPLLALDDPLKVPTLRSPALPGYCAEDSDGTKRRGLFATSTPVDRSVPALRAEIGRLALKHELLAFGEYSLQAMGYYAK